MADFKKLSAVEMVESAKDSATVLIEEDGVVKRVSKDEIGGIDPNKMVNADNINDNTHILIEENNIIKKYPNFVYNFVFDYQGSAGILKYADKGVYQALKNSLINFTPICLNWIIISHQSQWDNGKIYGFTNPELALREDGSFEGWVNNSSNHIWVHPDDTAEYYYDD